MSCSELTKLVKTYTNGEIPLEVYREQRRQIVDKVVDGGKLNKKNDPLDALIASTPGKTPATGLKSPSVYLTVAGATLAIGIGVFLVLNKDRVADQQQGANTDAEISALENKPPAQKLIEKFLHAKQWNEETVNQFILDWQILPAADRQEAKDAIWFTHFKSIVQNQLEKAKNQTDNNKNLKEDLLTSLLVTVDPFYFIPQPLFSDESETPSDKSTNTEPAPTQSAIVAESQKQSPPPTPKHVVRREPQTQKEPAAVTQKKRAPQKTPHPVKPVDYAKLNNILTDFSRSFQAGNLTNLMRLFSPNATTNYHSSAAEISSSYAELFKTTAARDMQFTDFSWKPLGNKIEGNGKYHAHLNPKGTNVDQVFSADVAITVDRSGPSPLIVRLYLTNQQFSTNLKPSAKTASSKVRQPPPLKKEELRSLLTDFVVAYNRGSIEELMGLFSQQARTNDSSNISDIRKDYVQLFQSTKSRDIVLKNIVWDVDGSRAVANGVFEANIQPLSSSQPNVYRGKIRIAVAKFDRGILITQLLHNTF